MKTPLPHDLRISASRPMQEGIPMFFSDVQHSDLSIKASKGIHKEYQEIYHTFKKSSFSNNEINAIWQTLDRQEVCNYCSALVGIVPTLMVGNTVLTKAIHLPTIKLSAKLQVLHRTTCKMLNNKGRLTPDEVKHFHAAGYTKIQLLEMVLGLSHRVKNNIANRLS